MKKTFISPQQRKWVLPVLVGIAACMIVWRVGFYTPEPNVPTRSPTVPRGLQTISTVAAAEPKSAPAESPSKPAASETAVAQPAATPDPNQNKPAAAPATSPGTAKQEGDGQKPAAPAPSKIVAEPNALNVSSKEGEAINLKDVEMRLIIQKIADWTGMVVIPTDQIMKEKITIYAPRRLPRKEALDQIYGALRIKGYTAEVVDKTIYLKPLRDARIGTVPLLAPEQPLAAIENKDQVVQKYFKLTNATASQISRIVQPMIGDTGHISADDATSTLFIIDTVRNLMRIEAVIAQFDVAEAQQLATEVFEVRNRPPAEVVQLLQVVLSGGLGRGGRGSGGRTVLSVDPSSDTPFRRGRGGPGAAAAVVSGTRSPVFLIAEPKFNWIIAKASTEDMQEIRTWLARLDQPVPTVASGASLDKIENKNQIVQRFIKLSYYSPDRMTAIIAPMLGPNGRILPEQNTNTLMVVDTVESLLRIERVIAQFDVPPREDIKIQVFELQHREPEEITTLLSSILGEGVGSSMSSFGRDGGYRGAGWATRIIRVDRARFKSSRGTTGGNAAEQPVVFIPEPRRKWIIVKARPEDLESIATWIKKLDQPVPTIAPDQALDTIENKTQIVQRFIKLTHCSPEHMAEILSPLLGPGGRLLPESNTSTLLIIDTVENVLRAEEVIAQFDVPPREDVVTQVFELQYREPEEITSVLSAILGDSFGASTNTFGRDRGRANWSVQAVRVDRARYRNGRSRSPTALNEQSATFIPEPQRKWIIVKARPTDIETITNWIKKLDKPMPTIAAGEALDKIENKVQIVQRFVKLAHCSVDRMSQILTPLLGPDGRMIPEQNTSTLLIIDTVENLQRMEQVITEFDVVPRENVVTQVFELQYREPDEITSVLSAVLGDATGSSATTFGRDRGRASWSVQALRVERSRYMTGRATSAAALSEQSAVFIPEPRRKWIIVKARPDDLPAITEWIKKLDKPMPTITTGDMLDKIENRVQIAQRFVKLAHCSVDRMTEILNPVLGPDGRIVPEQNTNTLLIIDTVENLARMEQIIAEFDVVPREDIVTQIFSLQFREPDEITSLLGAVMGDNTGSSTSTFGRGGRPSWSLQAVRVERSRYKTGRPAAPTAANEQSALFIPDPHRKWVIVKARPEDMATITDWIQKLDKPMLTVTADDSLDNIANKKDVVQRFIKLKHASVDRMMTIITPMLGDAARVTPEPSTGTLLIVDTVETLQQIEKVIAQFDVPPRDDTVTQVFELQSREPEEIVGLLGSLIGDNSLSTGSTSQSGQYRQNFNWIGTAVNLTRYRTAAAKRPPSTPVAAGNSEEPMLFIPEPKRKWIIVRARPEDMEVIGGWIKKLDKPMPTVTADHPLSEFASKNQVVQKFVKLEHCDAQHMSEILTPLLTENGHVTPEENTGTLMLIDTVENLMRIDAVIAQFDVAEADTNTEIFEVHQRSPDEIIALLETVLSDTESLAANAAPGSRPRPAPRPRRPGMARPGAPGFLPAGSGVATVIERPGGRTVVLMPETKQGWIVAKASTGDIAEIRKWVERLDRPLMTVTSETPLSTIENKNQVIQRCIKLHSYSASQMGEIVLPLLTENGYVSADENTGTLLLIDTVENLMKIEAIIGQFDVPGAEQTTTQVFEIAHADPAEVVQMLRMLLSDAPGRPGAGYGGYGGYGSPGRRPGFGTRSYSPGGSRLYGGGLTSAAASSVILGHSQIPIVLIPEPKRKWVIARASAEDMKLITEWVAKLDKGEPKEREYETVPITYADVREVATRINEALQQMPGTELQASVLVQALEQARQVMVFGRPDLRDTVKKMIEEIDVPPGQFETRHFQIKHADPDQIKKNIDDLFGAGAMLGGTSSYRAYAGYGARTGGTMSPDTVKTISHVSLKQVTVIASPENMKKIADQIEQWDVAVDVNEVRPRIIELRNSDPKQMTTLLKTLFSQEMSSRYSFFDYLFGSGSQDKQRIVGPLYGQVTFEEVTGTKKIVVISNIPQAYNVVEELVKELDSREAAEVPKVVRLKYADPENLSERLNAMFNEAGTSASIHFTQHGLSAYSMEEDQSTNGNNNARTAASTPTPLGQTTGAEYRPWWTTGRGNANQAPISNMIGRVRFIPDTHSKSILVLTPPEFAESIEKTINELDIPGRQLMLKAIIMQVDHQNMTSLGLQYSSDSSRWQTLDNENALVARNTLTALEQSGSLAVDPKTGAATGHGTIVSTGLNINVLIDFMMRELHAKILNQQTLWTKDNEEAQFFKGQQVAFQTQMSISDTGGRATSSFTYDKVGMTLRARPSITPEKNVDMIINIILSQLEAEVINNQPVRTQLDTTTNMVVQDGQTLMLGGMLFQEDSRTNRKVPFLGDLPLLGGLFRHKQSTEANSELIVFVTPYVIETPEQMLPEAQQQLDRARQKLDHVREQLKPLADDEDDESSSDDSDSYDPPLKAPVQDAQPSSRDATKEKP